jgi:hypothetical protein
MLRAVRDDDAAVAAAIDVFHVMTVVMARLAEVRRDDQKARMTFDKSHWLHSSPVHTCDDWVCGTSSPMLKTRSCLH